ncbi:hypothetical protein [Pseudonocardia nigra]|uniref:hypothetical protein n=1 Tax=Pseudonocardia nigra TaxID=1921578 RepID=UPI001FE7473F|nr:hypothetical protein [Pseudonocardia nigra]
MFRDGLMSALLELVFDLTQLRPHPLRDRDAPHPETPILGLRTQVCEAEEIERFRLRQTLRCSSPSGMPPKLEQPGLARMQFQPELREPLTEISQEPLRVFLILEARGEIVGETQAI